MGDVYEAVQEPLGRRVALKVLHSSLADNEAWVERFRREAELAASLGHPNIVQATDFGQTEDGHPFLVMDLVLGVSLADVLETEVSIEQGRAAFIADQVLAALETAHRSGVIHRDLKPENILLTSVSGMHDIVKILDFGIAGLSDTTAHELLQPRLTRTGQILGTPAYMSPEHARGLPLDERSDLYAVGVILFECLAGRPPIEAESYNALLFAIVDEQAPNLLELQPELDPALAALVERALAKDPRDRFSGAAAMRSALKPFVRISLNGVRMSPAPRPIARRRHKPSDGTETYEPRGRMASAPTEADSRLGPEGRTSLGVGAVGLPWSSGEEGASDSAPGAEPQALAGQEPPSAPSAEQAQDEPASRDPADAPTVAPPADAKPRRSPRRMVARMALAGVLLGAAVALLLSLARPGPLPALPELAAGEPPATSASASPVQPQIAASPTGGATQPAETPAESPSFNEGVGASTSAAEGEAAEAHDHHSEAQTDRSSAPAMLYRGGSAGVVPLDLLRRGIGTRMPLVRRCYAGWSIGDDSWEIALDLKGQVKQVDHPSDLPAPNPKLRRCMRQALLGLRFGSTRDDAGGKVRVSFGRAKAR